MIAASVLVFLSASAASLQAPPDSILQPNRPPTGPLPLPIIGAELGIFGSWERGGVAAGKEPVLTVKAGDVQIAQFSATRVEDKYNSRGMIQVDVVLSKAAPGHYVDMYVSGYYVGVNGEVEGVKNVGRRPAYEFKRIDSVDHNKHPGKEPNRRFFFNVPDVLPAKVRVELYQISLGKPARLLGVKEAGLDVDWKDQGVIAGHLFGGIKTMITKASFMVQPGTESVNVRIPALKPIKPDDYSNDLNINLRMKGQTEIHELVNRNIEGREFNWKATLVTSGPSLLDRDVRNNHFWPYLKGAGYLEIPLIKAGDSPIAKYP